MYFTPEDFFVTFLYDFYRKSLSGTLRSGISEKDENMSKSTKVTKVTHD